MKEKCRFEFTTGHPKSNKENSDNQESEIKSWSCPHEQLEESDYCLFHSNPELTNSEAVIDAVKELLRGESDHPPKLVGARLPNLDLSKMDIDIGTELIDLRRTKINGDLDLKDSVISSPLRLTEATITGNLQLDSASFEAEVNLTGTEIGESLNAISANFDSVKAAAVRIGNEVNFNYVEVSDRFLFSQTMFDEDFLARNATFEGQLSLRQINFKRAVDLQNTVFESQIDFRESLFEGEANFEAADFERSVLLDGTQFENLVSFDEATFMRQVDIPQAIFLDTLSFTGARFEAGLRLDESGFKAPVVFDGAIFNGEYNASEALFENTVKYDNVSFNATSRFDGAIFEDKAEFTDAVFGSDASFDGTLFKVNADFTGAIFQDELKFSPAKSEEGSDQVFNLRGAEIQEGELNCIDENSVIDLRNAIIGNVELNGNGNGLEQFRIVNVNFEGFDFSNKTFRKQLTNNGWRLHTTVQDNLSETGFETIYQASLGRLLMDAPKATQVSDITNNDLETTYLRAKNGADNEGYTTGAAEFFIKQKVYRRRTYLEGNDSPWEWIIGIGNYLSNLGLAIATGYGERPFRPIFVSGVAILLFAAVYQFILNPPLLTDASALEHILFSAQNFVSFIVGPPPEQSGSLPFRVITAVESFTGAFFVALLVFSLTRSVDR